MYRTIIIGYFFHSTHAYSVNCVYVCNILYVVNHNQRDKINCSTVQQTAPLGVLQDRTTSKKKYSMLN